MHENMNPSTFLFAGYFLSFLIFVLYSGFVFRAYKTFEKLGEHEEKK